MSASNLGTALALHVAVKAVGQDCPVHILVDRDSTYGPPWRYEVSTCGPFTINTFVDIDEMVAKVMDGARST